MRETSDMRAQARRPKATALATAPAPSSSLVTHPGALGISEDNQPCHPCPFDSAASSGQRLEQVTRQSNQNWDSDSCSRASSPNDVECGIEDKAQSLVWLSLNNRKRHTWPPSVRHPPARSMGQIEFP